MKKNELIQMHQLLMEVYKFLNTDEVGDGLDLDNQFFDTYHAQSEIKPTSVNKKLKDHRNMVQILSHGLDSSITETEAKEVLTSPDTEVGPDTPAGKLIVEEMESETDDEVDNKETAEEEAEDTPDPRTDTDAKIENVTQDDVSDELLQKLRENNMAI